MFWIKYARMAFLDSRYNCVLISGSVRHNLLHLLLLAQIHCINENHFPERFFTLVASAATRLSPAP